MAAAISVTGKFFLSTILTSPPGFSLDGCMELVRKRNLLSISPVTAPRLGLLLCERPRQIALEDVELVLGNIVKGGSGRIEVLRQHFLGRVLEPVAQQKRRELIKVTLIKDQQKLASVWTETLDGVRKRRQERARDRRL